MSTVDLRDALRAEWTKARTISGPVWLLLGVVVATIAVSAAAAAASCSDPRCGTDPAQVALTGVVLGQAVVAVLAVLAIGTEYSTGMIGVTLTAMPRRTTVIVAKAVVLTATVVPAAAIGVVGSALAGHLILPSLSLTDGPVVRATVGSAAYLVLIGLLSLGIAAAVRNSATAIGIVFTLLFVYPIVVQMVPDRDWQRHLEQWGPMTAGLEIQATTQLDSLPIGPWAGLGVLAAWAGAALVGGGLLLHVRDA